jgi:hypothetical protein
MAGDREHDPRDAHALTRIANEFCVYFDRRQILDQVRTERDLALAFLPHGIDATPSINSSNNLRFGFMTLSPGFQFGLYRLLLFGVPVCSLILVVQREKPDLVVGRQGSSR